MLIRKWYFIVLAMMAISGVEASVVQVNFDSLTDGDVVTNQLSGLSFTNATVISAGVSLNEFEFPPRSGTNVVMDAGGAMVIDFASPVLAAGGYFTYLIPLTFSAYDSAHSLIGSVVSLFSSNLALSGDSASAPNEFLGISASTPISEIVILGDPAGYSFVMDDLTYTIQDAAPHSVPEPTSLALVALSLLGLGTRALRHNT